MVSERESAASIRRKIEQLDKAKTTEVVKALKAGFDSDLVRGAVAILDGELTTVGNRERALRAWREANAGTTDRIQRLIGLCETAHDRLGTLSSEERGTVLAALVVRVYVLG
jgi:hypothetical protein